MTVLKETSGGQQKVVFVFGGSGVIGREVCRVLQQAGCRTGFSYFSNETIAREIQNELAIEEVGHCDVTDEQAVRQVLDSCIRRYGRLDAVISCVGSTGEVAQLAVQYSELGAPVQAKLVQIMQINAQGNTLLAQIAAGLLQQSGGNIVITGSLDGVKAVPSPVEFAVSKSAIRGLVEALAKQAGQHNVRVNQVCPGLVDAGASAFISDEVKQKYLKYCGLKRFATVREVADTLAWFALENTYVTGQSIVLDGGL